MTPEQRIAAALPGDPRASVEYLLEFWEWLMQRSDYCYDILNPQLHRSARERLNTMEHWRTLLPQIVHFHERNINTKHLEDCDGFSATVADVAMFVGFDSEDVRVVRCWAGEGDPGGSLMNHAVCDVRQGDEWWRFDIYTNPPKHSPYVLGSAQDQKHRDVDFQNMPFKRGNWRLVKSSGE